MPKISVVGSMNVDIAVKTDKMPIDGETVIGNDIKINPGGKGANQAIAAARLGGEVEMFGCIGRDDYGELVRKVLKREGIYYDNVKTVSDVSTGVAVIVVTKNDNRIITIQGANAFTNIEYINTVKEKLLASDLVLLQQEIPPETIEYVIRLCSKAKIPVILNPAPAIPVKQELIDMVQYIIPNEHEAAPVFQTNESLNDIMLRYPNKLIITLGKNGAAFSDGESIVNVPAIEANPVDSTGAGDTFLGAFAKSIGDGAKIYEAIVFAQYASGLSIEKFGAQAGMPTMREINERRGLAKREKTRNSQ
jgi:ribokinase